MDQRLDSNGIQWGHKIDQCFGPASGKLLWIGKVAVEEKSKDAFEDIRVGVQSKSWSLFSPRSFFLFLPRKILDVLKQSGNNTELTSRYLDRDVGCSQAFLLFIFCQRKAIKTFGLTVRASILGIVADVVAVLPEVFIDRLRF